MTSSTIPLGAEGPTGHKGLANPTSLRPAPNGKPQRTCVVTGAAGFIGSHLCERLVGEGWRVRGIDAFTDSYDPAEKLSRAAALMRLDGFSLHCGDMASMPLDEILSGSEVVFHLGGRPGVRPSFDIEARYVSDNVVSTARLLEAATRCEVRRVVYASSSSVYGNGARPFSEEGECGPISPYGRTKLEAERACLGAAGQGLEAVALRYFTVYGPRQRPDMGIRIFAEAALQDRPLRLLGDGSQIRDFTYVADIVEATVAAADAPGASGLAINVGGGSTVSLIEVLSLISDLTGKALDVRKEAFARGDVFATEANLDRARSILGFSAKVPFEEGLAQEISWVADHLESKERVAA